MTLTTRLAALAAVALLVAAILLASPAQAAVRRQPPGPIYPPVPSPAAVMVHTPCVTWQIDAGGSWASSVTELERRC